MPALVKEEERVAVTQQSYDSTYVVQEARPDIRRMFQVGVKWARHEFSGSAVTRLTMSTQKPCLPIHGSSWSAMSSSPLNLAIAMILDSLRLQTTSWISQNYCQQQRRV